MMKSSQIRDLRNDERQEKLGELNKKLYELRCQSVTENLPNRHAIRNIRKDIARIKTIMRQDQLKVQ
jgi:large subunit ribosomal protein L29